MSWALEIVAKELEQQTRAYGIEVKTGSHFLVTRDLAIKMEPNKTTDYYRKFITDLIKQHDDKKKAELAARQISLL